ncbi:MAG: hypothetical protein EBT43_05910, partial [Methylocystaceae bacterium]|nr:hypothetical protein [Methylocystaceae bacterium]
RYLDDLPLAKATTGNPVYTNVDGYHIYTFNNDGSIEFAPLVIQIPAEYFLVGGGGGASKGTSTQVYGGGGGGAEGKTGSFEISSGKVYAVKVGAGGLGSTTNATNGTPGEDSSIDYIVAKGGGQGNANGVGGTSGTGYPGQSPFGQYTGGGGGGATGNGSGYTGGAGVGSNFTGSSLRYCGGGGGSSDGASGSGTDGGGNGAAQYGVPTDGRANSGGGGGSSRWESGRTSAGNGGSGIAVIRYPTTYKPATITGSVTQQIIGGNYVYVFTDDGTIKVSR